MNTIETVQALVARYETCAAETDAALRSARALLAQMQTEPIKAGSLDDALYSPDGSFGGAQSPTPVAPTFDEWWENHGKYNALFKFDHNASPSDRLARAKELMSLSWEVARESPAPVAVQPDMAQWPDQRNRGLLQAAKQALASLDRHAILPWGQPGYPAPTPGADLLYEARDYLRPAIEREQAWREVVPPLSASPEDKPK